MQTITKSSKSNDRFATVSRELVRTEDRLTVQAAKLQQENHYLRRVNKVRPHLKLVVRAEAAAHLLALWHVAGYLTSRYACMSFGMSERTYYAGKALLVAARVHNGQRWTVNDPDTIEARIRTTVERCRKSPEILAWRMPLSKRPKAFLSAND